LPSPEEQDEVTGRPRYVDMSTILLAYLARFSCFAGFGWTAFGVAIQELPLRAGDRKPAH
jgi:hypothetical protein